MRSLRAFGQNRDPGGFDGSEALMSLLEWNAEPQPRLPDHEGPSCPASRLVFHYPPVLTEPGPGGHLTDGCGFHLSPPPGALAELAGGWHNPVRVCSGVCLGGPLLPPRTLLSLGSLFILLSFSCNRSVSVLCHNKAVTIFCV